MSTQPPEKIVVEVPEGFPAMSEPTDPETRLDESEIVLSKATAKDLDDIVHGLHTCFPEVWWGGHEPASIRADPATRRARMVKRCLPWLQWDGYHPIKASLRSNGEFVGFAGWHAPNPQLYKNLGGKVEGVFRRAAAKDNPEGIGFAKMMGWSEAEVDEMWSAVDVEHWEAEFATYDRVRTEELGGTPHWYLAPLFVTEKFRGRGVGRMLLDYGIEKADAQSPATPLYLEALPNARPVYLHMGFKAQEGPDRGAVMIRNGIK